jgi:hypothetical protein
MFLLTEQQAYLPAAQMLSRYSARLFEFSAPQFNRPPCHRSGEDAAVDEVTSIGL